MVGRAGRSLQGPREPCAQGQRRRPAGRLLGLELRAQAAEAAVERDLDRVRALAQELGDLARAQIAAVAEGEQLAVELREDPHAGGEVEPARGLLGDVGRVGALGPFRCGYQLRCRRVGDAAAGDADQPGKGLAPARVVALPVAKGPLEALAGDVLRLGPPPIR